MKITINEMMGLNVTLGELAETKMSTVLAYKLARISKKVRNELETAEEKRMEVIGPFLEKDENGNPIVLETNEYKLIDGKRADVTKELQTFFATEIETDIPTITLEELEELQLTTIQMENLMKVIKEK